MQRGTKVKIKSESKIEKTFNTECDKTMIALYECKGTTDNIMFAPSMSECCNKMGTIGIVHPLDGFVAYYIRECGEWFHEKWLEPLGKRPRR